MAPVATFCRSGSAIMITEARAFHFYVMLTCLNFKGFFSSSCFIHGGHKVCINQMHSNAKAFGGSKDKTTESRTNHPQNKQNNLVLRFLLIELSVI